MGRSDSLSKVQPLQVQPTIREKLKELKECLEDGLIEQAEFDAKKAELLGKMGEI